MREQYIQEKSTGSKSESSNEQELQQHIEDNADEIKKILSSNRKKNAQKREIQNKKKTKPINKQSSQKQFRKTNSSVISNKFKFWTVFIQKTAKSCLQNQQKQQPKQQATLSHQQIQPTETTLSNRQISSDDQIEHHQQKSQKRQGNYQSLKKLIAIIQKVKKSISQEQFKKGFNKKKLKEEISNSRAGKDLKKLYILMVPVIVQLFQESPKTYTSNQYKEFQSRLNLIYKDTIKINSSQKKQIRDIEKSKKQQNIVAQQCQKDKIQSNDKQQSQQEQSLEQQLNDYSTQSAYNLNDYSTQSANNLNDYSTLSAYNCQQDDIFMKLLKMCNVEDNAEKQNITQSTGTRCIQLCLVSFHINRQNVNKINIFDQNEVQLKYLDSLRIEYVQSQ